MIWAIWLLGEKKPQKTNKSQTSEKRISKVLFYFSDTEVSDQVFKDFSMSSNYFSYKSIQSLHNGKPTCLISCVGTLAPRMVLPSHKSGILSLKVFKVPFKYLRSDKTKSMCSRLSLLRVSGKGSWPIEEFQY